MAKTLTARSVEQHKPDPKCRLEIPDGLLTGLYLVVQPSGAKSWAVRYRHGGKSRKMTLGPYPAVDLGQARKAGKEALQAVAEGRDPGVQKITAKIEAKAGRDLIGTVFADFLNRHAKNRRTRPGMEKMWNLHVADRWRGRRVQDIRKRDIIELLDDLEDGGMTVGSNRVLALVRKFFNWCVDRDIIDAPPTAGVKPRFAETTRERVLDDDEIERLWKATETVGYPFGPLTRLLLVTGQRLDEVASMPWSELKLDKQLWSLPGERTKNKRAHDVPLSDLAIEIIEGLPKIAGTRPYLFTTTGETPVSGFSRAKAILDRTIAEDGGAEVPHWTFHDLRRTASTKMQRIGIAPHVIDAVTNHKSGVIQGVSATYARYDYADEKRAALDAWAVLLRSIVEGREYDARSAGNVVNLQDARA